MPTPQCPRCGYDQSGETARWSEQCPLEGLCSECGLTFVWANAFNPDRERLKGFVEHSRGAWRTFLAAWRTWWWALLPWRFWSRAKLEHRIHPFRLGSWIFMLLVPLKALAVIAMWIGLFLTFQSLPSPGPAARTPAYRWLYLNPVLDPVAHVEFGGAGSTFGGVSFARTLYSFPPFALSVIAGMLAFPCALLVLPHTRAQAKIRPRHVVRAWVYSLAPFVIVVIAYVGDRLFGAYRLAGFGAAPRWPLRRATPPWTSSNFGWGVIVVWMLWLLLWWFCALKLGFRMQRVLWPMLATVAVTLCGALVGAAADQRMSLWRLFDW